MCRGGQSWGPSSTSAEPALLKAISQARGAELKRNVLFSHLCTEEEGEGEGEGEEREEDLEDGQAAITTTPPLSASNKSHTKSALMT